MCTAVQAKWMPANREIDLNNATAIYARYSSENQRKESIEDQIAACKRFAADRGFNVLPGHVYADEALSGSRHDRPGLVALREAASRQSFGIILVDDLSRLARDNLLMLSMIDEFQYGGIRVISVADGLDSENDEAALGIQMRGMFNEHLLRDLKKKTLRGQLGQKQRGFSCGERTYGYRSVPVGELVKNKQGQLRPEGYRHEINPEQAPVVFRVFRMYADGTSVRGIVSTLNEEMVPGNGARSNWAANTVGRMLDNEKYTGRWTWNKHGTRRDLRTGRRRKFAKPESEWIVSDDEQLRIIPDDLWRKVRVRRKECSRAWPGVKGRKGFSPNQAGRASAGPTHLLAGILVCSECGGGITQVCGKAGGYLGCRNAHHKKSCGNKVIVRRTLAESIVLEQVCNLIASEGILDKAAEGVQKALSRMSGNIPGQIKAKKAELATIERRVANLVGFIAEGNASKAIATTLAESEERVETLRNELDVLVRSQDKLEAPGIKWIKSRLAEIGDLLSRRVGVYGPLLRDLLGSMVMEPTKEEGRKPYFTAKAEVSFLKAIALLSSADGKRQRFANVPLVEAGGFEPPSTRPRQQRLHV